MLDIGKKHTFQIISIILEPALNQKVHMIQLFKVENKDENFHRWSAKSSLKSLEIQNPMAPMPGIFNRNLFLIQFYVIVKIVKNV